MNGYFLLAGLLLILLSVAHIIWGEKRLFNVVTADVIGQENFVSLYIPWHQGTFVLFASGVGMFLAASLDELVYLPYFVLVIVIGNLAIFILSCVVKRYTELFRRTVPQTVLFLLLIALIILGITS
jgi:hypothetical protein